MIGPREFLRETLGQPTAVAVAFLLGVWVTFNDMEDTRLRTSDRPAVSAKSAHASHPFVGDLLLQVIGIDPHVDFTDGPSGRPRLASERNPITKDAPNGLGADRSPVESGSDGNGVSAVSRDLPRAEHPQ